MRGLVKYLTVGGVLVPSTVLAQQALDIGTVDGGNEGVNRLTAFMQQWISFATGPWAIALVAASIVIGVGIWMFMPREGWMGWIGRALIGGIIILNVGPWMQDLGLVAGG